MRQGHFAVRGGPIIVRLGIVALVVTFVVALLLPNQDSPALGEDSPELASSQAATPPDSSGTGVLPSQDQPGLSPDAPESVSSGTPGANDSAIKQPEPSQDLPELGPDVPEPVPGLTLDVEDSTPKQPEPNQAPPASGAAAPELVPGNPTTSDMAIKPMAGEMVIDLSSAAALSYPGVNYPGAGVLRFGTNYNSGSATGNSYRIIRSNPFSIAVNRVIVETGVTTQVTLQDAAFQTDFDLEGTANLTLLLAGTNSIKGS
ncbi:MAG: hypothetical protein FWD29_10070, partial [Micrococcales bacterium]|nr:hypothetical protein [Micrococcales bacterium]